MNDDRRISDSDTIRAMIQRYGSAGANVDSDLVGQAIAEALSRAALLLDNEIGLSEAVERLHDGRAPYQRVADDMQADDLLPGQYSVRYADPIYHVTIRPHDDDRDGWDVRRRLARTLGVRSVSDNRLYYAGWGTVTIL